MTLLPNLRSRNRYECWAPFGHSVRINSSILQPPCEIGSLPEATQLVCSVRIQTQAPASRHLNQKASSPSACISQLGRRPQEKRFVRRYSVILVSWTAGLKWAHPDCLMPLPPTLGSQGCDNPQTFLHLFPPLSSPIVLPKPPAASPQLRPRALPCWLLRLPFQPSLWRWRGFLLEVGAFPQLPVYPEVGDISSPEMLKSRMREKGSGRNGI